MMFRNAARVIVILSVTAAVAQSTPPAPTVPGGPDVIGQGRGFGSRRMAAQSKGSSTAQTPTPLRQRMDDLQSTLKQMHTVLKQMNGKAAKSTVKDPVAKANLDMWELMVGHLDKELADLRVAVAAREDMEARRAALYKQADQKAEAQAQAARAAQAAKFARAETGTPAAPRDGGQTPAAATPAGQSSAAPANNSPSPN